MDNKILLYNNALSLNLKQTMTDVNDVLYNMQSLKQFQWNINQIQKMKNGVQMQINMASLSLFRNFILDEGYAGISLFRNLIRKYYSLNDNQIIRYENIGNRKGTYKWIHITNLNILKRKGCCFYLNGILYKIDESGERSIKPIPVSLLDLFYDIASFDEIPYQNEIYASLAKLIYAYSCNIDFFNEKELCYYEELATNQFTKWNWNLVEKMYLQERKDELGGPCYIQNLLQNDGFFAQIGINNVRDTLDHLQEIIGASFKITEEMKRNVVERLEHKGTALYSYRPISKEFILQHQNELDWKILQKNPRIQWDWELLNLYLRKIKDTVSEDKQAEYLLGSKAMYAAIENYLNDDILNDIEKLYNIV